MEAARQILINQGPQAVTLKSVASAVGRTHANLLHHFGSAAELQQALSRYICDRIIALLSRSVAEFHNGTDAGNIADHISRCTYEAFSKEGGGPLAAWMITNGQAQAFQPVLDSIGDVVREISERYDTPDHTGVGTAELVLLAFGHSILGPQLCDALGIDHDVVQKSSQQRIMLGMMELDGFSGS